MQENEPGNQKDTPAEWTITKRYVLGNQGIEVSYSHITCGSKERAMSYWTNKLYWCSRCHAKVPEITQFQINLLLEQ